MKLLTTGLVVVSLAVFAAGRMRRSRSDEAENFIGAATNQLSRAILQSYVDDESNLAFSPFGFSAILAILAEGARGETLTQLRTALKLPEDIERVRSGYQRILKKFYNTNEYKVNNPEFKNWFYVYKNYTINDNYKEILEKYYQTDVKSVNKYDSSFIGSHMQPPKNEDPLPEVVIKDPVDNSKDVQNFEQILTPVKEGEKDGDKKSEEPSVKPEEEKIITFAMEDKPQKTADDVKPVKSAKDKLAHEAIEKKKHHDLEIMEAVEARNHARSAKNMGDNAEAHGLSANRVGNKDTNSLMILFNGLYFRGTWKTPFQRIENSVFYTKSDEKKSVPTMRSKGNFKMGSLPGLSSNAIEIPYEADKYSLIIILPKDRDGLKKLSGDLVDFPLYELSDMLYATDATITMPMYYLETTTKPLAALAEFGVGGIFSPKADLSGISSVEGLFVQEMVQHVSVKIDDTESNASQISAGNPSVLERSGPLIESTGEQFIVDHPFLYFVKDVKENVVVAAGKVYNPVQEESFH